MNGIHTEISWISSTWWFGIAKLVQIAIVVYIITIVYDNYDIKEGYKPTRGLSLFHNKLVYDTQNNYV